MLAVFFRLVTAHWTRHGEHMDMHTQLYEHMSTGGTIVSCELMIHQDSGRSKGWGLVTYSTPDEAQNARRKSLNGLPSMEVRGEAP